MDASDRLGGLKPLAESEFATKQVAIDKKGKVTVTSGPFKAEALQEQNELTIKVLHAASRILKGEKFEDKGAIEKLAKKMIEKMDIKPDKLTSDDAHTIAKEIDNVRKSLMQQSQHVKQAELREKLLKPEVYSAMIEGNGKADYEGIKTIGQDVMRHLMGGIVSLTDTQSDLFLENDTDMKDLSAMDKLSDADRLTGFIDRTETLLKVIQKNLSPDDAELAGKINDLIDAMRKEKSADTAVEILLKQAKEWKGGSENEKSLVRLLNTLNQALYVNPVSNAQSLLEQIRPDAKLVFGKKSIEIAFDKKNNTVTALVRQETSLKDSKNLQMDLTLTLTSSLQNPKSWACDIKWDLKGVQSTSEGKSVAKHLQAEMQQLGMRCYVKTQ